MPRKTHRETKRTKSRKPKTTRKTKRISPQRSDSNRDASEFEMKMQNKKPIQPQRAPYEPSQKEQKPMTNEPNREKPKNPNQKGFQSAEMKDNAIEMNKKAQWKTYNDLQAAADKAWSKLRQDIERKAPIETLIEDRNALTLVLGECDYMKRECTRLETEAKK